MKKIIHKICNVDKKIILFLILIVFIGLITGSLYITILDTSDMNATKEVLSNYMMNINPDNYTKILSNNFIINISILLIMWLMGFSIIGLPITLFLLFFKAFTISFTISSFIVNYNTKGILYGFFYNFPHQIIMLVIYLYVGCYAIKVSSLLIKAIIKKEKIDFKLIMNRYLLVLFISLFIITLMTILETFLLPLVMTYLVKLTIL